MRPKSVLSLLAAGLLFACPLPDATAIQMYYDIGSGSQVNANAADPGLVVSTRPNPNLDSINFWLNDYQAYTFDFFKIWTDESDVAASEDTVAKQVEAMLDFDVPDFDAYLGGTTAGVRVAGIWQYGRITWNGPIEFTLGGRTAQVTLSNEQFNKGLFGLNEGEAYGATVKATVKQLGSYGSVPDHGSVVILLGLAFMAVALIRRGSATS